jgi:prevent-host-death family protein
MTISPRSTWNIARAKASLSELLRDAAASPQTIENRGRAVGVVLSVDEFRRLVDRAAHADDDTGMRAFLSASAHLRDQGGAELELPGRSPRSSPFDRPRKRVVPRRSAGR